MSLAGSINKDLKRDIQSYSAMRPYSNNDCCVPAEDAPVNPLVARRLIAKTMWNPFRERRAGSGPSLSPTPPHGAKAIPGSQETRKEPSTPSCPATPPKTTSSLAFQELVPAVAFPYVQTMTEELESSFRLIREQLPALPCEVQTRRVKLPVLRAPFVKTLVLSLEDTLLHIWASTDRPLPPASTAFYTGTTVENSKVVTITYTLRPHARAFVETLGSCFEIVVRNQR